MFIALEGEDNKSRRARLVGCFPKIFSPHIFKHMCVLLKICPLEVPFEIQGIAALFCVLTLLAVINFDSVLNGKVG